MHNEIEYSVMYNYTYGTIFINPVRPKTPKYFFLRGENLYFIMTLATQISLQISRQNKL